MNITEDQRENNLKEAATDAIQSAAQEGALLETLEAEPVDLPPQPSTDEEKPTRPGGVRRLLSSPAFRHLWIAQCISGIGDWLIIGILIPTVTALSGGSASAVGGIMVAKIIPALFLSSVTGVFVDHFDRRKIMIAADVVRLGLVLILLTTNSLATIYLVVLLMETAALFFWPARNALIPAIVDEDDVSLANGFMYTTQQCAMVVGLAASGAILAGFESIVHVLLTNMPVWLEGFKSLITPILVGSKAGYVLDSFTFIFSALLVFTMRGVDARPQNSTSKKLDFSAVGAGVRESFRFMKDHNELRGLLVTVFMGIVGGGAVITAGLDYINTLGGSIPFADRAAWIAKFAGSRSIFVIVFMALGMVTGALLIPRIEKKIPVRILFPSSVALFAVGMFGFALTSQYFIACLYAVGAGVCVSALTVAGNNYIVQEVSDDLRGRVFTALESVIRVSLLISMVVVAPLCDFLSQIIARVLKTRGITSFLGLELSGGRITMFLAGMLVTVAAIYGFKKVYFDARKNADKLAAINAAHAKELSGDSASPQHPGDSCD